MKYFLHLAYNGTKYHGWQRQEKVPSIQATIEDDLRKLFQSQMTIHGCGRTDAGVHASQYFAHFVVEKAIDFDIVYKLNRMLPDDIAVIDVIPVPEKSNAQRDAISRTYDYHIHLKKDPFLTEKSACYDKINLDPDLMADAVSIMTKYTDFRFFCLQPDLHQHTNCQLSEATMMVNQKRDRIIFKFTADRFLRGMIRIIVGRLLDIGQGKITLAAFEDSLAGKEPNKFMNQAYPQGLYLSEVKYREEIGINI